MIKNIKKHLLIIGVLLSLVCMAYGQTYKDGSYKPKWQGLSVSSISGWQKYDLATNTWSDTTDPLSNPFTADICVDNSFLIDVDFEMQGNIYYKTTDPAAVTQIKVEEGSTFTLSSGSTYNMRHLYVEKGAKFVNYGIVNGVGTSDLITLASGDTSTTGGTLENHSTINLNGTFSPSDGSLTISRAGATITGTGSVDTNANGAKFHIANKDGYGGGDNEDVAIKLTGTQSIDNACFLFNGDTDQSTGNLPLPVCRIMVDSGHTLTLSDDITVNGDMERSLVQVFSGSTLDTGTFTIKSTREWGSYSPFILESGATIRTAHPDGISSDTAAGTRTRTIIASGAIQLNGATYSSGANYVFYGTGPNGRQNCGYFETTNPDHVNNIINESSSPLLLDSRFSPLYADGGYLGEFNHDSTITTEGYIDGDPLTLPVEMSYFNAVFNGFNSVILQWATQSETNNLGFYVLRATEFQPATACVISDLIQANNTSQGATYYFTDNDLYEDGLYYYWLQDVSFSGVITMHGPIMVQVTLQSGSNQTPDLPLSTSLVRNYPNPFNPSTQLEYYLENGSDVDFEVYNLKGQLVDQFMLRNQESGFHRYTWEPQLSSGAYLIRFTADGKSNTRKVILSK